MNPLEVYKYRISNHAEDVIYSQEYRMSKYGTSHINIRIQKFYRKVIHYVNMQGREDRWELFPN